MAKNLSLLSNTVSYANELIYILPSSYFKNISFHAYIHTFVFCFLLFLHIHIHIFFSHTTFGYILGKHYGARYFIHSVKSKAYIWLKFEFKYDEGEFPPPHVGRKISTSNFPLMLAIFFFFLHSFSPFNSVSNVHTHPHTCEFLYVYLYVYTTGGTDTYLCELYRQQFYSDSVSSLASCSRCTTV